MGIVAVHMHMHAMTYLLHPLWNHNLLFCTGMLPEYEALASILEKEAEWERDAVGLRLRIMSIVSDIAEAFIDSGEYCYHIYSLSMIYTH